VYEVSPFSTNVGELAPSELEIPILFVIQPTVVEYCMEYIAGERIGGRVQ
jgi:hypothetical protein